MPRGRYDVRYPMYPPYQIVRCPLPFLRNRVSKSELRKNEDDMKDDE